MEYPKVKGGYTDKDVEKNILSPFKLFVDMRFFQPCTAVLMIRINPWIFRTTSGYIRYAMRSRMSIMRGSQNDFRCDSKYNRIDEVITAKMDKDYISAVKEAVERIKQLGESAVRIAEG